MDSTDSDYWTYRAELDRVVDGDTVDLRVDLGFRTYKKIRVRLENVDTAEIYGVSHESDEFALGQEQKQFVEEFLQVKGEWPLVFHSKEESGKYGRWIGDISTVYNDNSITEELISEYPEVEYE